MSISEENRYDTVPYPTQPFRRSHPLHLATVARLLGLDTPEPSRCRILELGCGDGGNLLPIAALYPGSSAVGIDLSAHALSLAQSRVRAMGLTNVELLHRDIAEYRHTGEPFDFVIVHGVMSWVPPHLHEEIFRICGETLAADGVALVSYNAQPGWSVRSALRELVLRHVPPSSNPSERANAAREILSVVARTIRSEDDHDPTMLRQEAALIGTLPDWLLFHDLLAPYNRPFGIREVETIARRFGLGFLAEADLSKWSSGDLAPEAGQILDRCGDDRILREESLDLLRFRMFRVSLFRRATTITRSSPDLTLLERSWYACAAEPEGSTRAVQEPVLMRFLHPSGGQIRTADTLLKAALHYVCSQYPRWVPYTEISAAVCEDPYRIPREGTSTLSSMLYRCALSTLLEISASEPPLIVRDPEDRPVAFLPARIYPTFDHFDERVPSLRHEITGVSADACSVLPLLDGTRTVEQLSQESGLTHARVRVVLETLASKSLLTRSSA